MLPIRDYTRRQGPAYVNYALIAANVAVFALEVWAPGDGGSLIRRLAVVPDQIFNLPVLWHLGFLPLTTLVTAAFLHGNWLHLGSNMLFLWVFGDNVEDTLGPGRYLIFYVTGGVVAALAHVLANPTSAIPTIGASGAVAAVLGAYVLLFPRARVLSLIPLGLLIPVVRIRAALFIGTWFALQLWSGIGPGQAGVQGVAWWAHIGGFLAGMGLVGLLGPVPRRRVATGP